MNILTEVEVEPGNCGFNTSIKTKNIGDREIKIKIDSECPHLQKAETEDWKLSYIEEFSKEFHDTEIYRKFYDYIPHISCPIYTAILKAAEVESGMALPQNVEIKFKENN